MGTKQEAPDAGRDLHAVPGMPGSQEAAAGDELRGGQPVFKIDLWGRHPRKREHRTDQRRSGETHKDLGLGQDPLSVSGHRAVARRPDHGHTEVVVGRFKTTTHGVTVTLSLDTACFWWSPIASIFSRKASYTVTNSLKTASCFAYVMTVSEKK